MARAKRDDPEQSKRFIEAARNAGAEEPGKDFERLFDKVASAKKVTAHSPAKRPGKTSRHK